MTEERNSPPTDSDALVSRTYRDIAVERAPEHLNKVILHDARKAARPRYLRSLVWTRPLAWAATVTLAVALVLEVSKYSVPEPDAFNGISSKSELRQMDADFASTAKDDAPASAPEESLPSAARIVAAPELDTRPPEENRPEPARAKEVRANTLDVAEFEIKDADMLQRADDMARLLDGENQAADKKQRLEGRAIGIAASDEAIAQNAARQSPDAPACDEVATATVESWLECIAGLEDAGFAAEAGRQRDALLQAFPDTDPR